MYVFYGVDLNIKSLKFSNENTGWVGIDDRGRVTRGPHYNIKELGKAIATDMITGHKVALGFEAPMWYPVPDEDEYGNFQLTARFQEEDEQLKKLSRNGTPVTVNNKQWYPIGLLLFEWMAIVHPQKKKIMLTTDLEKWENENYDIYLYEGFATGLYKPTDNDYEKITSGNSCLTNNEVIDAYITAEAVRIYVMNVPYNNIHFPCNHLPLAWIKHLRVCVEQNPFVEINSYYTDPGNSPRTQWIKNPPNHTPFNTNRLKRFMSVWEHIITDVNQHLQLACEPIRFQLDGKKACDVYGFKFR